MSMLVNHSFDYHFVQLLDKLQKKYGDEMFKLEGISRENLDISRFTTKFLETKTTADVSIDANANVDDMSILSYNYEYPKPLAKLNALYHLWSSALKKHGIKRANKMIETEIAGGIRIHDLHGWLMPYSYYQETPICTRINGGHPKIFSMKQIFEVYDQFKEVYPDKEVIDMNIVGKFLPHTKTNSDKSTFTFKKHHFDVLDGDGNWTGLTRILRHKRDVNMIAFQLQNGSYTIVTENHPVILEDGSEIEAGKLQEGMKVKLGNKNYFKEIKYEYIDISTDFAYLIGCLGGNKYEDNVIINLTNDNHDKLISSIETLIGKNEELRDLVNITKSMVCIKKELFKTLIPEYISFKNPRQYSSMELPINILSWTHEAKAAFIAGLIDSKFGNYKNGYCNVTMNSNYIVNYLDEILMTIGVNTLDKKFDFSVGKRFSIVFKPSTLIQKYSQKLQNEKIEDVQFNEEMYNSGNEIKLIQVIDPATDPDFEYVYDITTESHTFYSEGMTQHNCWAASIASIVNDGMPWVKNIKVKPVRHFDTLISNSIKFIYNLSTQCVGAIAVPDFLAYAEYFIRKDFGEEWYKNPNSVRQVRQGFQNWIYGVNDKARGNQSPFTNVSVFDKYWREAMFGKHTNPDFSTCNLENLKRTQREFVDVLLTEQEDNPFTFPVMTACQLKDKETGEILDKDWLDWLGDVLVKNKLMNIYTSDTCDSLSSCMFKGNVISVKNKKTGNIEMIDISDFIHKFIDESKTDIDANVNNYQIEAYNIFTGEKEFVDIKSVIKRSNKSNLKVTISTGDESISVSPDHIIAIRKIDSGEIIELTAGEFINKKYNPSDYEISTISNDSMIWKKIVSVIGTQNLDEDKNIYCLELDKLHYFAANNIISHNCCRLRNNINPLLNETKEYSNSFGVGGLSIGSHRVVALNLPQIAYMAKYSENENWTEFFKILESRVKLSQDILDIHRETLKKLIKNGNLPMYSYGCMDLSKQYSTVGFIGLYEALEIMGMDIVSDEGIIQGKKIIDLINKLNDERTAIDGNIRNIEQIPGESAAVVFCEKDKLQFANVDYDLYANQYIPLIKEALMADRIKIQGEFDHDVNGGSILHIDIDQPMTKEQIIKIIEVAAKQNVIYFALDDCLAQCKTCGKVYVGKIDKSPCHQSETRKYMRVVGFRTPVESWNKVRRTKDFPNRYRYNDSPFD